MEGDSLENTKRLNHKQQQHDFPKRSMFPTKLVKLLDEGGHSSWVKQQYVQNNVPRNFAQ